MLKTENIVSEINFILSISENFWKVRKTTDNSILVWFFLTLLLQSLNSPIWVLDYLLTYFCVLSLSLWVLHFHWVFNFSVFLLFFYQISIFPLFLSSFCFFPLYLSLSIYLCYLLSFTVSRSPISSSQSSLSFRH
jgi:hypothetical protein